MSKFCPHRDVSQYGGASRCRSGCGRLLGVLALLAVVRSAAPLAAEELSLAVAPPRPDFNVGSDIRSDAGPAQLPLTSPMLALPKNYQAAAPTLRDPFSPHDFHERGTTGFDSESTLSPVEDAPMLRGTTVWQRLADYRSHGSVRLLTLWESGASTVSLQAGRKGEPSLQWTSRLMNRGGATRGVLDQLVSASMAGASRRLQVTPHPTAGEPAARPSKLLEIGGNK